MNNEMKENILLVKEGSTSKAEIWEAVVTAALDEGILLSIDSWAMRLKRYKGVISCVFCVLVQNGLLRSRNTQTDVMVWEPTIKGYSQYMENSNTDEDSFPLGYHPAMKLLQASQEDRRKKALTIASRYGTIDGSHHKQWVIDQMIRALCGCPMMEFDRGNYLCVHMQENEEYEKFIMGSEWDIGVAP